MPLHVAATRLVVMLVVHLWCTCSVAGATRHSTLSDSDQRDTDLQLRAYFQLYCRMSRRRESRLECVECMDLHGGERLDNNEQVSEQKSASIRVR